MQSTVHMTSSLISNLSMNKLSGVKVPQAIEDIRQAEVRHDIVCDKEDMLAEVKKFLNI